VPFRLPKLQPYLYKLRCVLREEKDICSAAEQITLCPKEETFVAPAFFLDSQLDKVKGYFSNTNEAIESTRIKGGLTTHAATIAYNLSDTYLIGGSLYSNGGSRRLKEFNYHEMWKSRVESFDTAVLASTYCGYRYFGHWLMDDCVTYLAAQKLNRDSLPVQIKGKSSLHMDAYSNYFDMQWRVTDSAYFKSLFVVHDVGQNSYKKSRFQTLRGRLKESFPNSHIEKKVFIKRGCTGEPRNLINESVVLAALEKEGFIIVDIVKDNIQQILEKLNDASLVVGVEGSHLVHAFSVMNVKGAFVVIHPPYRFDNILKNYADLLGVKYGFVVGEGKVKDAFSVDVKSLLITCDLIASRT